MATTSRFNFEKFGGDLGGSIEDDGGKFSSADRDLLDRLLATFELHTHAGGERLADPSGPPTVALDTSGGGLLPGTTYYYRISYVDQYGLETAASDEVSVITPDPIEPPIAPIATGVSGGTLEPGLYYWAGTSMVSGVETPLGDPVLLTLEDQTSVELDFDVVPDGADAIGVWRQGPTDAGFTRIGETNPGETVFTDDGSVPSDPCACDPTLMPPEENLTGATSSVEVSIPVADEALVGSVPIGAVLRWRIYRTELSGVYDTSASLVHEIVETTDGTTATGLMLTWTDEGDPLLPGFPLENSTTLTPSQPLTSPSGGAGISAFLIRDGADGGPTGFTDDFNRTDRDLAGDNGWFESFPGGVAGVAIRSNQVTVVDTASIAGSPSPILHVRNDDGTFADVSLTTTFDTSGSCDTSVVAASDDTGANAMMVEVMSSSAPVPIAVVAGGTFYLDWDHIGGAFSYFEGDTSVLRVTYDDATKVLSLYQDGAFCFDVNVEPQLTALSAATPALADMPNAGWASNGGLATTEGTEHYDNFVAAIPTRTTWRVVADDTGALVTRTSGGTVVDETDIYLQSPDLSFYKLTIATDGALTTTAGVPTSVDTVFLVGQGPLLPCSDPTVAWQLGVANDGSLTTVEV